MLNLHDHPSQVPISSIKGEVKKNTSATAGRFLASQPTSLSRICAELPRHVLGYWTRWPSGLGFLCQRFSSLLRNEACQFRNPQGRTSVKFGDRSSIRDSWPIQLRPSHPRTVPWMLPAVNCACHQTLPYRLRNENTNTMTANDLRILHPRKLS